MLTFRNSFWLFDFFSVYVFKTVFANSNIRIISEIGQLAKSVGAFAANGHSTFPAVVLLEEDL